jgi:hypothetical protein
MKEKIFKFIKNDNETDSEVEEISSSNYRSLTDVLTKPQKILGSSEDRNLDIKRIDDRHQRCRVHVTHQKILFNDDECELLMIRDISAQTDLIKAQEKNSLLNQLSS